MYKDNPLMDIDTLFEEIMFPGNTLGWDIGGNEKTVRGVTRDELVVHYRRHYSPKNMVLAVAGAVTPATRGLLEHYFGPHAAEKEALPMAHYRQSFARVRWPATAPGLSQRVAVRQKKLDQVQFILGFPGIAYTDKNRYALSLLSNILGGGMSSRLFVEVREKRGLVYMIRTGVNFFRDTGTFCVQAGIDPSRLKEAVRVIRDELVKIAKAGVSPHELRDAKNNIAGGLALSMEDCHAHASWYANMALFYNETITPEEQLRRLKKVTAAEVQQIARALIDLRQVRVASIGPTSKAQVLACFS